LPFRVRVAGRVARTRRGALLGPFRGEHSVFPLYDLYSSISGTKHSVGPTLSTATSSVVPDHVNTLAAFVLNDFPPGNGVRHGDGAAYGSTLVRKFEGKVTAIK